MEFLLINHPLDCPICDQGGECDLQDQAMAYGIDGTRYDENKRAVEDKYIGPLVKTIMTRCIQCTRCVRFMTEIAGVSKNWAQLAAARTWRSPPISKRRCLSEMQGQRDRPVPCRRVDVGPGAHQARPWELRKTETIDVMDAVGSTIRVDARGREVMRICRATNDGQRRVDLRQDPFRLGRPSFASVWINPISAKWQAAPASGTKRSADCRQTETAGPDKIAALTGDLAGAEEMFALKM
jgi:NADH-quinone oxidoreductase subunit G